MLRASNSCRTKVEFRHEPSSYQLTISHQKVASFRTKSSRVTRHAVTVTSTARLACCTTPALASTGIDELTRRDRFAVVFGLIREPGRPAAGSRLLSEESLANSLRLSIGHDIAGRPTEVNGAAFPLPAGPAGVRRDRGVRQCQCAGDGE